MTITGTISRITRKGDWIARTDRDVEILLPDSDKRLSIGLQIYFRGLTEGRHNISFPDGNYQVGGTPPPVVDVGVIDDDHIKYEEKDLDSHWSALLSTPGRTNLNKKTGPKAVDIGTLVDIHSVKYQGMNHRWIDKWSVSPVQYPVQSLNPEQRGLAERLSREYFNGPKP